MQCHVTQVNCWAWLVELCVTRSHVGMALLEWQQGQGVPERGCKQKTSITKKCVGQSTFSFLVVNIFGRCTVFVVL